MKKGKIVLKRNGDTGITKITGCWSVAHVAIIIGELIVQIGTNLETSPERILGLVTNVVHGSKVGEDHE
jgi:hypothetical protein